VQKKFTKKLHGFAKVDYVSRMDMLNLELLHVRRLKQDSLWCYNILMDMLLLILPSFSHYPIIRGLEDIPIKSIDNRAD